MTSDRSSNNPWGVIFILIPAVGLIIIVYSLFTGAEKESTPISGLDKQTPVGTMPALSSPIASSTPTPSPTIIQEPSFLSGDWWSQFFSGLTKPTIWLETLISVLLVVILTGFRVLIEDYPRLITRTRYSIHLVPETFRLTIDNFFERAQAAISGWIETFAASIARTTRVGKALIERVLPTIGSFLNSLWLWVARGFADIRRKINEKKWYEEPGVIDPGLIEVSLAVTAVIVSLPGLSSDGTAPDSRAYQFNLLRVFVGFIPIWVSIEFINLYARDRGANNSSQVLFSPITSRPFFLLSWSILGGILIIVAAILGLPGN